MAPAVATFNESKPPDIGIPTVSQRAIRDSDRPGPSEPSTIATRPPRGDAAKSVVAYGVMARTR